MGSLNFAAPRSIYTFWGEGHNQVFGFKQKPFNICSVKFVGGSLFSFMLSIYIREDLPLSDASHAFHSTVYEAILWLVR